MTLHPRITFGIIALNAQPFLEHNLRALYPYAHQLIVVEGAAKAAASLADDEGHSTDDTLMMLKRFQEHEDPEDKLFIVSAQDEGYTDGFWPEKKEMSQAYARRATGDWLWQVDSDEFYRIKDLQAIIERLITDPNLTTVSFPYYEFFGGFDYLITGKWHLAEHTRFHRLFRWGRGYHYASHRPPTVLDEVGRDLRSLGWEPNPESEGRPIHLYHYSYVLPKQAKQKVGYYANVDWTDQFRANQRWLEERYFGLKQPLFLGEKSWPILQWLERFTGKHPQPIDELRTSIEGGAVRVDLRPVEDIEHLLRSPYYRLATCMLRLVMPIYWRTSRALRSLLSRRDRTS
jgi:hypothetical protein